MAMTEAQYIAMEGNVKSLFKSGLAQKPDLSKDFFKVITDKTAQFTDYLMGSAGTMTPWQGSVDYDTVDLGHSKQYRPKKFSTGIQIDRDMYEDGEYQRLLPMIVSAKADGVRTFLNAKGAAFYNDAFAGSLSTTADGNPLCYASHTLKTGGATQSNTGTYDLNYANLNTVLKSMQRLEDDRGNKMLIEGSMIIAGLNQQVNLRQLFGSDREAFVGDNQINAFKDFSYKINPLIDGDVWFVVNPMLMLNGSGAIYWIRRDPRTLERDGDAAKGDFNTEKLSWKAVGRIEVGATNWTWIYGNNPS